MIKDTSITTHTHITQNMDSSNSSSSWDETHDDENTPQQDATDAHWIWQQLAAIDSCIFPCCYQSAYVDSVGHNLKKVAQLIPAHKVFHLKARTSPELILDRQILHECSQWRKRFNDKIKFQTDCIWNASQENNKSQVGGLFSRPKAINNSSDHGEAERAGIDQVARSEMTKYDREECINSLRTREDAVKSSTVASTSSNSQLNLNNSNNSPSTATPIHGGMELSGVSGNLNSRLKSICLLDAVGCSSSSITSSPPPPPTPVNPGNLFAASASKSSYKLAWISQQSQSVTEVKELQGGPSKTGLPALVPPRKKSFSAAVASSPFYPSNNLQVRKACRGKNEPLHLDNCSNSNNSSNTNNCNINSSSSNSNTSNTSSNSNNSSSGNAKGFSGTFVGNNSSSNGSRECSSRITLPPLSTAISVSSRTSGGGDGDHGDDELASPPPTSGKSHQLHHRSNLSGQMNKKPIITPCSSSIRIFSSPFSSDLSVTSTPSVSSPFSISSLLNCDYYGQGDAGDGEYCCCTSCLTTFDISSSDHMSTNCTGPNCQGLSSSATLPQYQLTNQMESCNIFYPIGTYSSEEMETSSIIDVDDEEEDDETTDTYFAEGQAKLLSSKCHFTSQSSKTIGFPVPPSLVQSITSILKDKWEEKEQTN